GVDCTTFAAGLKGALRQDPDVILVGEMRDLETIETAIMAAETGHLVLSTLHTLDATETVTRVISAFPDHQRDQVRLILSNILKGVVSQRLVPRADGHGMVPAVEVLVSTALVRECIAVAERTREIRDAIARGYTSYGMQTFDQSLLALAPRTEADLTARLVRLGYRRETADTAVARCRELGWVGDAAYANDRARALRARGAGSLKIAADLAARGLSEALVEAAIVDS